MNFPAHPSSQSSPAPDRQPGATSPQSVAAPDGVGDPGDRVGGSSQRSGPIPPPSHAMQYRAIGLIWGQYRYEDDKQITRGEIALESGTTIDAVLLGRTISVIKNHIDLEKPHLWVVYPRTHQENDDLHVQIVGVWEPQTLSQQATATEAASQGAEVPALASPREAGHFSIRGEVVYYAEEEAKIIVKIRQLPRQESERAKFFKLKLSGTLPMNSAVNRFWDLGVHLEGKVLQVSEAKMIGVMPPKKSSKSKRRKPASKTASSTGTLPRPQPSGEGGREKPQKPTPRKPVPKPQPKRR